ncbi:MAG: hypothetical protein ABGW85_06445 [Sulfurimonas sp.]
MAKKKKSKELTQQKLSFVDKGITYKLIRFNPENMTVDVLRYEGEKKLDTFNIPFAHLPRELKRKVKPT